MNLIKDGNLATWLRASIWVSGLLILFASFTFSEGRVLYFGAVTGLIIAAIGGYAEKANALHLKPFDRFHESARKSYEAVEHESADDMI